MKKYLIAFLLALLPFPAFAAACSSLTSNIVDYYKLDESSGNPADTLGINNLTNTGTTPFSTTYGIINNGASFNGTSQYFSNTSASSLSFGTGDFSISMWINIQGAGTAASNGRLFFIDHAGTTPRIYMDATTGTGNLSIQFYDGTNGINTSTTVSANAWHYVDFIRSGGTGYLYVDGTLAASATNTYGTSANANLSPMSYLKLGSGYEGTIGYYDGYMDEVGIWSCSLTSSQITTLYNSGAGLQYPFSPISSIIPSIKKLWWW